MVMGTVKRASGTATDIGGVTVTSEQLRSAIELLTAAPGQLLAAEQDCGDFTLQRTRSTPARPLGDTAQSPQ
jgi:hypothetical protein